MLQYTVQLPPLSLSKSRKDTQQQANESTRIFSKRIMNPSHNNSHSSTLPQQLYTRSPLTINQPLPTPSTPWKIDSDSRNPTSTTSSLPNSLAEDILSQGDIVGKHILLQGEPIKEVSSAQDQHPPADEFEVVRRLGTGSYAVVYLVREVLSRSFPSEDGHIGSMDMDDKSFVPSVTYGRDYAIKCLSKANLNEDALAAQLSEVTIHQSLPSHPNIVTLHRTYQTSSFLLLLLEYVPGEDLFYFLDQARDHYDTDPTPSLDPSISPSRTPPTPTLLASLHPTQLLSPTRLRLIASMFGQMCDAVATCHDQQVFHRDIKPENFIVTDGYTMLPDNRRERKVIVKLTDFGLSTTETESSDMDCGSAPYMSFECRNNVAPFYMPRAADVWSLGIVLINMLYHRNPWTDTAEGACKSFDLYRYHPTAFFMHFDGMTPAVADFLTNKVFCILPASDPCNDSPRVSAGEFGKWVKDLPTLFGTSGHKRVASTSSTQGHPLAASRPASAAGGVLRTPILHSRGLSRPASFISPAFEEIEKKGELETVIDQELDEYEEDPEQEQEEEPSSRATSTTKRRKRGARGRGGMWSPVDDTLETLAVASQTLAREISKASRSSSVSRSVSVAEHIPPVPTLPPKKSKWKLGFGGNKNAVEEVAVNTDKDTGNRVGTGTASNVSNLLMGLNATSQQPAAPPSSLPTTPTSPTQPKQPRSPADQASTWARGRRPQISATYTHAGALWGPVPGHMPHMAFGAFSTTGHANAFSASSPFSTPSRAAASPPRPTPPKSNGRANASGAASWRSGNGNNVLHPGSPGVGTTSGSNVSGASSVISSGASIISTSGSVLSSTASTNTSSSGFTRYSNSSLRSISTAATSVSSGSWRAQSKPSGGQQSAKPAFNGADETNLPREVPKNIKFLSGVPWELDELPRALHPNPVGDIFGGPPVRKQRTRKGKDSMLDTISERPGATSTKSAGTQTKLLGGVGGGKSAYLRRDAATSTTDLDGEDGDSPKKVQKGQINALAKMLSALRR